MANSNNYLLEVVDEQKKTIEKYSNRLRDVVAAHKSLLIEKKALEDSIKILNVAKDAQLISEMPEGKGTSNNNVSEASEADLKSQLSSLLSSFSKIVEEKSHMEECFKSNQKQLLDDKKAIENRCQELKEQVKALKKQLKFVENKNQNEFLPAKKDSQKIVWNLKQQSGGIKNKFKNLDSEVLTSQVVNYEKEIKNLKSELETKQIIQEMSEKKLNESFAELTKLQEEMRSIQLDHEMAILKEKEKAKSAEEHAKKLTVAQEERVFNLETRLADLSETIGSYDRLRLQDQIEIQKLKEHIAYIDICPKDVALENQKSEVPSLDDYESIKKRYLEVKNQLYLAAQKYEKEEDFRNLFSQNFYNEDVHFLCKEEYNKLKVEYESFKNEVKLYNNQGKSCKELIILQNQVKNLQEKVKIITNKNEEMEKEYQLQVEQLKKALKNEKAKYKEMISASETDHKARVWFLEEQLQKQRERFLALLEEKEQEMHTLQNTFHMFLPGYRRKSEGELADDSNVITKNQFVDGPHIVHYANELARRELEISSLRRNKHNIEMTLRDLQKEMVSAAEKHREERQSLLNEITRFERCQTREGANLEYLKNVVYNFLLSSDPKSKRHMCNAIAAVLKFSEEELQKVIDHSKNSWWTRSSVL